MAVCRSLLVGSGLVLLAASQRLPPQMPSLCGKNWSDCTQSHCCMDSRFQCYEKNSWFAECMLSCTPGNHSEDPKGYRTPWSCRIRSPFGSTGPLKTSEALEACKTLYGEQLEEEEPRGTRPVAPLLHCFAVVSPGTYESNMVAMQFRQSLGVFSCDAYTIVSNVTAKELFHNDKHAARKIRVSMVDANLWVKMQRGPAGWDPSSFTYRKPDKHLLNSPVFIKVWDKLFKDGDYKHYDWTLKLDVDAFPVAERVKNLLRPHTSYPSKPLYILNTAADMYGNFLHGPVEALSKGAMDVYNNGSSNCRREVDYSDKGEDFYLNLCLEHLHIQSVKELRILSDAYMWGSHYVPCDGPFAVFHPLKSPEDWKRCMQQVCPTNLNPWAQGKFFVKQHEGNGPLAPGSRALTVLASAGLAAFLVAAAGLFAAGRLVKTRRRAAVLNVDAADREPCLERGQTGDLN